MVAFMPTMSGGKARGKVGHFACLKQTNQQTNQVTGCQKPKLPQFQRELALNSVHCF